MTTRTITTCDWCGKEGDAGTKLTTYKRFEIPVADPKNPTLLVKKELLSPMTRDFCGLACLMNWANNGGPRTVGKDEEE